MAAIHIVEHIDNLRRLKDSSLTHEWESGRCAVSSADAEKLVGADLYIHEARGRPSRFGGKVTGYRPAGEESAAGAVVFRFQASNDHRDIKTSRAGWVEDRKIVW